MTQSPYNKRNSGEGSCVRVCLRAWLRSVPIPVFDMTLELWECVTCVMCATRVSVLLCGQCFFYIYSLFLGSHITVEVPLISKIFSGIQICFQNYNIKSNVKYDSLQIILNRRTYKFNFFFESAIRGAPSLSSVDQFFLRIVSNRRGGGHQKIRK